MNEKELMKGFVIAVDREENVEIHQLTKPKISFKPGASEYGLPQVLLRFDGEEVQLDKHSYLRYIMDIGNEIESIPIELKSGRKFIRCLPGKSYDPENLTHQEKQRLETDIETQFAITFDCVRDALFDLIALENTKAVDKHDDRPHVKDLEKIDDKLFEAYLYLCHRVGYF